MFGVLVFFVALLALQRRVTEGSHFDWQTANTSIWLSSGAYCPTEVYLNRTYLGHSSGFVPTKIITDAESDTAGYMGYLPEQSAIYIVLRGSVSFQNWVDDFDALQVPFNNSDCTDCYVHQGFNYAWNQVATSVLSDVLELRKQFPDYSIIVTGHSLGGALASLCAITLQEHFNKEASVSNKFSLRAMQKLHIIPKVRLFTFGAPRFSNEALAAYTTNLLSDRNRITHYKDMAPHCPPYLQYMHIEGEYYESIDGSVATCAGYEDPLCSGQWYYTSIADHMYYLSLPIGCASVSAGAYQSVLFKDPKPLRFEESNPEPRDHSKGNKQVYQRYERDEEKNPAEYLRERQQLRGQLGKIKL